MKFILVLVIFLSGTISLAEENIYQIQGSVGNLDGVVNAGSTSTKAKFQGYDIEAQALLSRHWLMGLSYDNFNNNKSVNNSQIGFNLGYNFTLSDNWNWSFSGGAGVANYKEKSNLQDINTDSVGLRAETSLSYQLISGLYLQVNYKYIHQMFTDGASYWSSNPRSDVVFDLHGLGVGLGWRW